MEVWVESEKEIKRNVAEIITARDRNVNSGDAPTSRVLLKRADGLLDDIYGMLCASIIYRI